MSKSEISEQQVKRLNEVIAEDEHKDDYVHQWMYSFLPADVPSRVSNSGVEEALFLVGYCKNCRKSFSNRIGTDTKEGFTALTQTDVPKWGCSPANIV